MPEIDLSPVDGDRRGVANRETFLCKQIFEMLKNNGYFCLEFTEKGLHNLALNAQSFHRQPESVPTIDVCLINKGTNDQRSRY